MFNNLKTSKLILGSLNKSYINGQWVEGRSQNTHDIVNPYDRTVLTTVRLATVEQLRETFENAKEAQKKMGQINCWGKKLCY